MDLKKIVHINKDFFPCVNGYDDCEKKERTIAYGVFIDLPEQIETPEIIFKECCYKHFVYADSKSNDSYKNDFSGFWHKRQINSERVDFIMLDMGTGEEIELNGIDFGELSKFGDLKDLNLCTFVLNWREVLLKLGTGSYKIIKRVNLAGNSYDFEYLVYNLEQYSEVLVDKTTRIDITLKGLMVKYDADFTDSNFKTSLRVGGFFGRREVTFEEDNLIDRNYKVNQISISQKNEYKYQTNLVPDCITREIFDFILFSDDIRLNDYNLNNHDYNFKNKSVKIQSNEGTNYFVKTRKARINLLFTDKFVDNKKRNY